MTENTRIDPVIAGLSNRNSRDVIADFGNGADRIDLLAIDANAGLAGNRTFNSSESAVFAGAGQLPFVTNGGGTASSLRRSTAPARRT